MSSEFERLQGALPERYSLIRELDGGGMSRVYLAREHLPERLVAIKVFDEEVSARMGRERFMQEIEVTSKLGHPHIVPILSAGEADGTLFYTMPYIEGDSLRTLLGREGQLAIDDAVRIACQVADALQHAHERGVVHRDVKPANVLFQSGHAVVADFGIARALSEADRGPLTQSGHVLGTPDYMSPEQIESGNAEAASDLYALACVVFEMIGGEPPFLSRTSQATFARHLGEPPRSLGTLRPSTPAEIEEAVRKALSKAPRDRQRSAREFGEDLRREPAAKTSSSDQGWRDSRRAFGISLRIAGTLLVAGAIGFASNAFLGGTRAGATAPYVDSVAVMPFENRSGDVTLDNFGPLVAEAVSDHLAGVTGVKVIDAYTVASYHRDSLGVPRLLDTLDVGKLIGGSYDRQGDDILLRVFETNASGARGPSTDYRASVGAIASEGVVVAHQIAETFLDAAGIDAELPEDDDGLGQGRPAYVTGKEWLGQRTPGAMAQAIAYFQASIDVEPDYAPAHAGISSAYALSITYNYNVGPDAYELAALALEAADEAVRVDSTQADGYASRGYILALLGIDVDQAEADFARAELLAPGGASGLSWSARILAHRGLVEEALTNALRAVELDPGAAGRRIAVASLAFQLGDYDMAIDQARIARRFEPTLQLATAYEARALALTGRGDECRRLPLGAYDAITALCLLSMNDVLAADEWAAQTAALFESRRARLNQYRSEIVAQELAAYYAHTGNLDEAIRWVEIAFERSPAGIDDRMLGSELFAPLRADSERSAEVERLRNEARMRVAYGDDAAN